MSQASGSRLNWLGFMRGPMTRGPREAVLILVTAVALYMILALWTYQPEDPGWSRAGPAPSVVNEGGVAGAWLADIFLYLFGLMAYVFPFMLGYGGWLIYRTAPKDKDSSSDPALDWVVRGAGFILTLGAGWALLWALVNPSPGL